MKTCPEPKCQPGYKIVNQKTKNSEPKLSPMFQQSVKTKTSYTKSSNSYKKSPKLQKNQVSELPAPKTIEDKLEEECIEFVCIPEKPKYDQQNRAVEVKCPIPECPKGYDVLLDNELQSSGGAKCSKYTCEPTPQNDAVCNVTGRTFNTFDGTEFKYDICNHLLARDILSDDWNVISKFSSFANFSPMHFDP